MNWKEINDKILQNVESKFGVPTFKLINEFKNNILNAIELKYKDDNKIPPGLFLLLDDNEMSNKLIKDVENGEFGTAMIKSIKGESSPCIVLVDMAKELNHNEPPEELNKHMKNLVNMIKPIAYIFTISATSKILNIEMENEIKNKNQAMEIFLKNKDKVVTKEVILINGETYNRKMFDVSLEVKDNELLVMSELSSSSMWTNMSDNYSSLNDLGKNLFKK